MNKMADEIRWWITEETADKVVERIIADRQKIVELEAAIKRYEEGFQGACLTCETVGEKNIELEATIKQVSELPRYSMYAWGYPALPCASEEIDDDGEWVKLSDMILALKDD